MEVGVFWGFVMVVSSGSESRVRLVVVRDGVFGSGLMNAQITMRNV